MQRFIRAHGKRGRLRSSQLNYVQSSITSDSFDDSGMLWLAFSPKHRQMLAFSLGKRRDETCQHLLDKLQPVRITRFYSDNWESYQNLIPNYKHWIGKQGTQRIERQNLNFRTHLKCLQRRTICFSKSREMLEAAIKLYIYQLNSPNISFVTYKLLVMNRK